MGNFDHTIDNRWRPDLEASHRRVREEEAEQAAAPVFSRELSFVPARRREADPHDAQTRALIARQRELERLPHGADVTARLEDWRWIDRMHGPAAKQRYLEPIIDAVRRDPVANEHLLLFLLVVLEPVRRGVSKAFVQARGGLTPPDKDARWSNRAEARLIQHVHKQQLYDVTRAGLLEAIYRYPADPPRLLFPWLREAIAHRALDHLRAELPEIETMAPSPAEAKAVQEALAGFEQVDAPPLGEPAGLREWRARFSMRDVFDVVEEFFQLDAVREACTAAVGRLPRVQGEVIDALFFAETPVAQLAAARKVSSSTIYNHSHQAKANLRRDDSFFAALHALGKVRDRARARELAQRYPDGRLPDGRRIVLIDAA